jgi:hypothetical protein
MEIKFLWGFRKQHCNTLVLRESDTVWVLLFYTIYRIRLEQHMQEHDGCYISGEGEDTLSVHGSDICK